MAPSTRENIPTKFDRNASQSWALSGRFHATAAQDSYWLCGWPHSTPAGKLIVIRQLVGAAARSRFRPHQLRQFGDIGSNAARL
jgi:hypothetical protein